MNLNTFWKQPAEGFTEKTRGRTEDEICMREEQIGYKFPKTYRELMKLQNGGFLRKSSFEYNGELKELLYNGAIIDGITPVPIGYQNMLDVLSEWMEEDEIDSISPTEYNFLDRLRLISHMDGHSFMCLDYGWQQETIKKEPEICFFSDDFNEYLRLNNFDDFINGLKYYGYTSNEYRFGLLRLNSLELIKDEISKKIDIEFEEKTGSAPGWFNFKKWYRGELLIEKGIVLQLNLTPNQFSSGNYIFQEREEVEIILSIAPTKNKYEALINDSSKYLKIMKDLFSKLSFNNSIEDLLIPENKESK